MDLRRYFHYMTFKDEQEEERASLKIEKAMSELRKSLSDYKHEWKQHNKKIRAAEKKIRATEFLNGRVHQWKSERNYERDASIRSWGKDENRD